MNGMKQSQTREINLLCIIEGNEAMAAMIRNGISSIFSESRNMSIAEVVLKIASARSEKKYSKTEL